MIKQTPNGEPIFVGPLRIMKELKYLHNEMPSFCYSWIWEAKCVNALEKEDFEEQITELKTVGCIRRCQVYAKETITIGKNKFYVRLVSYGSNNPKKMYLGPSHLAHAFNKLMFDYVFVFLEKEQLAKKRMTTILVKANASQQTKKAEAMRTTMKNLLKLSDQQIEELTSQQAQ